LPRSQSIADRVTIFTPPLISLSLSPGDDLYPGRGNTGGIAHGSITIRYEMLDSFLNRCKRLGFCDNTVSAISDIFLVMLMTRYLKQF